MSRNPCLIIILSILGILNICLDNSPRKIAVGFSPYTVVSQILGKKIWKNNPASLEQSVSEEARRLLSSVLGCTSLPKHVQGSDCTIDDNDVRKLLLTHEPLLCYKTWGKSEKVSYSPAFLLDNCQLNIT